MKTKGITIILVSLVLAFTQQISAQVETSQDSIASTKEVKNRNVMLNASNDNQPRQISIGLPTLVSASIFTDGLPESYYVWPCLPYKSWKGTANYSRTSLMSLGETALRYGSVCYAVNSFSKQGTDTFAGQFNYTLNHFGKQTFDLNISGPLAKGWSYSIGSYQNFDPGSNKLGFVDMQDRSQTYHVGLTRLWDKGELSLFYKYYKATEVRDGTGPFIYNGDGSVTAYEGFELGTDAYLPENMMLEYMDIKTGEMVKTTAKEGGTDNGHSLNLVFKYLFDNGTKLQVNGKFKKGNANITNYTLSGIDDVTGEQGYTYEDGGAFSGKIQNRQPMHYEGFAKDWLLNTEWTGNNSHHSWRLGLDEWLNYASVATSTFAMAHEVKADPESVLYQGSKSWNFNTGGEYYDGHENRLALYASDDWSVTDRLWLSAGLRLEYYTIGGNAALNLNGNDNNSRVENFNLKKEGVEITPFKENFFNMAATANGRYTLFHGFGLIGEYVFNRQSPRLEDFAGSEYPSTDPVDIHLGRLGLFYNNKWLQLVSQFSYVTQTNNKGRVNFTKQLNGVSETVTNAVNYNIETLGWTTDMVIKPFKGFDFHGLFTYQVPKYKNYVINPIFSDGSSEYHDYSDKIATGISKIIVEMDPSYMWDDWRVWASFRYQSKQYINKTNSLFFNGRWETFAGIDYRLNRTITLSGSVINFLNQKGVSGSIATADLVDDASAYHNYLMAGDYIRPFTMELSVHLHF